MLFLQDEKRQNQPRTNEQRVQLPFWGIFLLVYKLQFQTNLSHFCSKEIKAVKSNTWKLLVRRLPSTKLEKIWILPRAKGALLTGINKLKKTQATESFLRDIHKQRPTKSGRTQIFFMKNGKKLNRLKNLKTSFSEDIYW